jgi:ADP-heptose:LPS heptosyltransferase
MAEKIVLTHKCAPGDITCLTGLARDLAAVYPGRYEVHVATHCKTLWDHNPYIASAHNYGWRVPPDMKQIRLNYGPYISEANRKKLHFITAFHRNFEKHTDVQVPCMFPKGDLHLDEKRYKNPPIDGRYWVLVAGHKTDFTTKAWSTQRWQQLADRLQEQGLRLVQVGGGAKEHINPTLSGVLNLVGQTNLRDGAWLTYHAEGVICPITWHMHMSGAFDKPCVVIAGGREHWWWEAYVNVRGLENFGPYCVPVKVPHRYLHTQDLLDCCKGRGCWKNKILHTQRDKNKSYCRRPVDDDYGQTIPECLKMITVDHVVEAVMSYSKDGTLPPIGDKPDKLVLPDDQPAPAKSPSRIDLFAPPEQIIKRRLLPRIDPVPKVVNQFEGQRDQPKHVAGGDPFDHPLIGGKATICLLMYGDYPDMHKSCLGSILASTAPNRREIRVVTNQLCLDTRAWLDMLKGEDKLHTLIHNDDNRKKYPAMRQLFHDPENPITTNWIIWFDDDSIANRDPQWYRNLMIKIVNEYPRRGRMVGDLRFFTLHPAQIEWAKTRSWWHGRSLQTKKKMEAPNGNNIFFAAGGFWALETAAMREAQIPDPDIGHNGGDYIVGLQLWQQGYRTAAWNTKKSHVYTSSVGRRGLSEVHTGMNGWRPGGVPKNQRAVV